MSYFIKRDLYAVVMINLISNLKCLICFLKQHFSLNLSFLLQLFYKFSAQFLHWYNIHGLDSESDFVSDSFY